ncbi:MAG: hypothetical protein J3R72DRAFT_506661 [Linnemannia gamsii]|nr:MAG: hypothetical protein J3R72DRAFT_506661 [Linnemannia gamsii]
MYRDKEASLDTIGCEGFVGVDKKYDLQVTITASPVGDANRFDSHPRSATNNPPFPVGSEANARLLDSTKPYLLAVTDQFTTKPWPPKDTNPSPVIPYRHTVHSCLARSLCILIPLRSLTLILYLLLPRNRFMPALFLLLLLPAHVVIIVVMIVGIVVVGVGGNDI